MFRTLIDRNCRIIKDNKIPSIEVCAGEIDSIATDKHVALKADLQDRRGTDWTNNTGNERLSTGSLYRTRDVDKLHVCAW